MELLDLEDRLNTHVIGQGSAVREVSQALRRSSTGIRNPRRPLASFLFAGPSGVGKAFLADAISFEFFGGSEESLIRIDMGEGYNNLNHFVSQLTESIRRKPSSVVLFYQIDKAHLDVANAVLRIIDDGTLTDGKGRRGYFGNAIVIMTFSSVDPELLYMFREWEARQRVSDHLKDVFGVGIWERVDKVVVFGELTKEDLKRIVEVMVGDLKQRVKEAKRIQVDFRDGIKTRVVQEAYDPDCGAKALKIAFARLVENTLADAFLDGSIKKLGRAVTFEYHNQPCLYKKL